MKARPFESAGRRLPFYLLGIILGATAFRCFATEEKPYTTIPGPAKLAATIRPRAVVDPPSKLDGLSLEIRSVEIARHGETGLILSVGGLVLNGFDEDVFVRKIEACDIGASGEAVTQGSQKVHISAAPGYYGPRNEYLLLAGRDRTGYKEGIRDDGGSTFRYTKVMGAPGVLEMHKLVTSPQIIDAEATVTIDLMVEFYRKGDSEPTSITVSIPVKVRVLAQPSESQP